VRYDLTIQIWKVLLTVCYSEEELLSVKIPLTDIPIRQTYYPEILELFKKAFGPLHDKKPASSSSVATKPALLVHDRLVLQHAGFSTPGSSKPSSKRPNFVFVFFERFCEDIT